MNHKIINLPIYIFWKLQLNYHFLFVSSVSVMVLTKYTLSLTSAWPSNMQNVATGQPLPPNIKSELFNHIVCRDWGKLQVNVQNLLDFYLLQNVFWVLNLFRIIVHKTLWNAKHKEVLRTVAGSTFGLPGEDGLNVKPGTRKITNCLPSHFCKVLIQYKQEVSD